MSLVYSFSLAAQAPINQVAEANADIYNLDRNARTGGIEINGPIDKAVASQAVRLIRSIRPCVDS
jgi:hypothetical protein